MEQSCYFQKRSQTFSYWQEKKMLVCRCFHSKSLVSEASLSRTELLNCETAMFEINLFLCPIWFAVCKNNSAQHLTGKIGKKPSISPISLKCLAHESHIKKNMNFVWGDEAQRTYQLAAVPGGQCAHLLLKSHLR